MRREGAAAPRGAICDLPDLGLERVWERACPQDMSDARAPAPAPAPAPLDKLTPLSALRLLSICDSESGVRLRGADAVRRRSHSSFPSQVVLFERVWTWPQASDPKGVGNLVRSFFLIAKQLDHGMVTRVVFESPPAADDDDLMVMLCTKNERVARRRRTGPPRAPLLGASTPSQVVAVFHETLDFDEEDEEIHAAMRQLVEQTRELWRPDVDTAQFTETVDQLCSRIIGADKPPPPVESPAPKSTRRRPNSE